MIRFKRTIIMATVSIFIMSCTSNAAELDNNSILNNAVEFESSSKSEVTEIFDWNFGVQDEVVPYGTYFAFGRTGISKESSKSVYISGSTSCYETCNTVKVNVTLQKLKNGSWCYVTERSHTEYNSTFSSVDDTISVDSGYYYRVVSVHSATKNGKTETGSATSSSVYVG